MSCRRGRTKKKLFRGHVPYQGGWALVFFSSGSSSKGPKSCGSWLLVTFSKILFSPLTTNIKLQGIKKGEKKLTIKTYYLTLRRVTNVQFPFPLSSRNRWRSRIFLAAPAPTFLERLQFRLQPGSSQKYADPCGSGPAPQPCCLGSKTKILITFSRHKKMERKHIKQSQTNFVLYSIWI